LKKESQSNLQSFINNKITNVRHKST